MFLFSYLGQGSNYFLVGLIQYLVKEPSNTFPQAESNPITYDTLRRLILVKINF